jgi:hypothetical protein
MTNTKTNDRTETTARSEAPSTAPRVAITSRWSTGRGKPKLVTFSWGATAPSMRR